MKKKIELLVTRVLFTLTHNNTYNDPLIALSEFKPDFYDLMLIDINMPKMNGFDFCVKVFEVDINPTVCFIVL